MQWKFFLGACFLTGALLLPHAGRRPVVAGMALAALVQWGWSRIRGGPRMTSRYAVPDAATLGPGVTDHDRQRRSPDADERRLPAHRRSSCCRPRGSWPAARSPLADCCWPAASRPLPLWLLAAEVLATILGLFLFGSFRYQIHKNALTYGMLLVIIATFVGLPTSTWHAEIAHAGLGGVGAVSTCCRSAASTI